MVQFIIKLSIKSNLSPSPQPPVTLHPNSTSHRYAQLHNIEDCPDMHIDGLSLVGYIISSAVASHNANQH